MKNKSVILDNIYKTQINGMNIRAKAIHFYIDFIIRIQNILQLLKKLEQGTKDRLKPVYWEVTHSIYVLHEEMIQNYIRNTKIKTN